MPRATLLICLLLLSAPALAWSTLQDWATVVATQIKAKQPLPVLSAYGASLNLPDAYAIQKLVVQNLATTDHISGFKAGLTRPRGQVEFNVREPVAGVIFDNGLLRGDVTLHLRDFKRLTIAPALGFVLKAPVTHPLTDLAQLTPLIGAVMPVVDFSDFRFERESGVSATDLVAGNMAFARLLVGKPLATMDAATVNGVLVELSHDDAVVDRGRAVNVMGSQHTALFWLINKTLAQGWKLHAGMLLVTGGFSDPVLARPGRYAAKFWDATDLRFTVER
jgi:2-keto-4-pentenoate hydratase